MEISQTIISLLTLFGAGGIIGGYISFSLNKHKELEFNERELKQKRYKSILLFMDAYLEPDNITYLNSVHPALKNARDTSEWLKAEYRDMMLYSSKEVIITVRNFINAPSEDNFNLAILAMREDLRDKNTDLSATEIAIRPPR